MLQDGAERPGMVPWEAPGLAAEARARGLHAHMGRVSGARRIRYAQSIGCTSFDPSRYSRWHKRLLDDGLSDSAQLPQLRLLTYRCDAKT